MKNVVPEGVISGIVFGVFLGFVISMLVVARLARAEPKYTPPAPPDHAGVFGTITTGGPFTFAGGVLSPSAAATNVISVSTAQHELASIRGDGRVFLNGKEVHTDREYREVMMALAKGVAGCKP